MSCYSLYSPLPVRPGSWKANVCFMDVRFFQRENRGAAHSKKSTHDVWLSHQSLWTGQGLLRWLEAGPVLSRVDKWLIADHFKLQCLALSQLWWAKWNVTVTFYTAFLSLPENTNKYCLVFRDYLTLWCIAACWCSFEFHGDSVNVWEI